MGSGWGRWDMWGTAGSKAIEHIQESGLVKYLFIEQKLKDIIL